MKKGPEPILTAADKREIIAMISAGVSKTLAAQFVGCSVSTLYRERRRDPQFRRDLERGAAQNVLYLKQLMRRHAEKSWRAAAWLLEREYPNLYARRDPEAFSAEDAHEFIQTWTDLIAKCPYAEAREWLYRESARLQRNAERFAAAHAAPWERDGRPHPTDIDEIDPRPIDRELHSSDQRAASHKEHIEPVDELQASHDELDGNELDDPDHDDYELDDDHDPADIDLDRDLEDERARQAAITPPHLSRWPHDRKFTYRDVDGRLLELDLDDPARHPGGGYWDMERLREAIEFATPKPNPMASAWVHYCQEQGIGPEEKARLEREYRQQQLDAARDQAGERARQRHGKELERELPLELRQAHPQRSRPQRE